MKKFYEGEKDSFMLITLLGVIFFVLSIWQFYWSFKAFQEFKKNSSKRYTQFVF
jgi:hypothetical protein